jgi:hypothetical protein
MNIWLIIGIIAVVGGIIALFVLRKKGIIDKPKPPAYDGNKGLKIPEMYYAGYLNETKDWPRPDTVPVWIDTKHKFAETPEGEAQREAVNEVVNRAARRVLFLAEHYHPSWKGSLPPITEMHLYFIEKMGTSEGGLPVLFVQGFDHNGNPISLPQMTAGTVIQTKSSYRPTIGGALNPIVVLPIFDGWTDLENLYNFAFNEFEHQVEFWVSWEEFLKWSGFGDAHPHRQDINAPVGFKAQERASHKLCAGAIRDPATSDVLKRF